MVGSLRKALSNQSAPKLRCRMEIRSSGQLERDIAQLEEERNRAIEAEGAEREAELQRQKQAEETTRKAKARAVRQQIAIAERARAEDIKRDLAWPAKIRETCFSPATNPAFKAWGLCQGFLDRKDDQWCGQCSRGFVNPSWLRGLVHKERAREPC